MTEGDNGRSRTGGCLCGSIRYRVDQASNDVFMCHCIFCRRSVTSVAAYIRCEPAGLVVLAGKPKWYRSSPAVRRGFCARCGSQLFWESAHGVRMSVSSGSLDQTDGLRVIEHRYADQRPEFERLDPTNSIFSCDGE